MEDTEEAAEVNTSGAVGIKFHMLERTSTPVFLHYVLANIVNMFVVFG